MFVHYNKIIIQSILLLLIASNLAHVCNCSGNNDHDNDNDDNYNLCWHTNSSQCIVHATLSQAKDTQAPLLPMDIDCRQNEAGSDIYADSNAEEANLTNNAARHNYLLRNFNHTLRVTLNGCHTPLQKSTYIGFEYLPHCSNIRRVLLERFHSDILPILSCALNKSTMIEMLHLQYNELSTISRESLNAFGRNLREMRIFANSLRYIERQVCNILLQIELIEISNEVEFMLKSADSDLFYNCSNLMHIKLHKLHSINVKLFQQLPLTLGTLIVSDTAMELNDAISLHNPQQLLNVSFIRCALHTFRLFEVEASVQYLNLSGNLLKEFHSKNVTRIKIFDLSYNQMPNLPLSWLEKLPDLKYISLQGNFLLKISLTGLLSMATNAELIDLRNNHLILLTEESVSSESENVKNGKSKSKSIDYERVRLQVGNNPWNCKWLLHFAHKQPEKFHIFQYDKFISQLNVNGLACSMESQILTNYTTLQGLTSTGIPIIETTSNNNTLFYDKNYERRNQRAEALIIVFLLPLGIACLFVLLYMWIYCQKVFHWSFYRSCRWPTSTTTAVTSTCQQQMNDNSNRHQMPVDVIRNLTQNANINDNYEVPLNGILTICNNCKGTPCNTCSSKEFETQAPFNITYDSMMPYDAPHKLYEEITSDDINMVSGDDKQINTNTTTTTTSAASTQQQIYDHLSFEQPATYL